MEAVVGWLRDGAAQPASSFLSAGGESAQSCCRRRDGGGRAVPAADASGAAVPDGGVRGLVLGRLESERVGDLGVGLPLPDGRVRRPGLPRWAVQAVPGRRLVDGDIRRRHFLRHPGRQHAEPPRRLLRWLFLLVDADHLPRRQILDRDAERLQRHDRHRHWHAARPDRLPNAHPGHGQRLRRHLRQQQHRECDRVCDRSRRKRLYRAKMSPSAPTTPGSRCQRSPTLGLEPTPRRSTPPTHPAK